MIVTYSFREIAAYGHKSCKCSSCGKRVQRKKKFYQTLSPLNKNKSGELKTSDEIYREERAKADEWEREPVQCTSCLKGNS